MEHSVSTVVTSSRQNEVVRLAADGMTDKAIASALNISPSTVNSHFRRLFSLYGTNNRTRLIALIRAQEAEDAQRRLSEFETQAEGCKARIADLTCQVGALRHVFECDDRGIVVEDAERNVRYINRAFVNLLGIGDVMESMDYVGMNLHELTAKVCHLFADPERFIRITNDTFLSLSRKAGNRFELANGQALARDFVPMSEGGHFVGAMWRYSKIEPPKALSEGFPKSKHIALLSVDSRRRMVLDAMERTALAVGASRIELWGLERGKRPSVMHTVQIGASQIKTSTDSLSKGIADLLLGQIHAYGVVRLSDMRQSDIGNASELAAATGARAMLSLPVMVGPSLVGALVLMHSTPRAWDLSDQLVLRELSHLIALSLESASEDVPLPSFTSERVSAQVG